jgi:16S rRNA (guanine966-N2)-methyltransferase
MRIIAGTYRGRRLRSPPGQGTRPTTDRVREALFNVLGNSINGLRVLDCYAGSGALGIEALSRGARSVVFVEKTRQAADIVRGNLATIGLENEQSAQVLNKPIEHSLSLLQARGPFDLWLVDPPFSLVRDGTCTLVLSALVAGGLLAPNGLVVFEYPSDQECPSIKGLHPEDIRHYGDSRLALYGPVPGVIGS